MVKAFCGFQDNNGSKGRGLLVAFGPTLSVQVGFDSGYRHANGVVPALPKASHPALVDTGATESCIDSTLASALKLPIVERQKSAGAHGIHELNIHLAQIRIPALNNTTVGRFAGVHLHEGGQQHFALIGRTFLKKFTLTYDGMTGPVVIGR